MMKLLRQRPTTRHWQAKEYDFESGSPAEVVPGAMNPGSGKVFTPT
jgi:hypothetical protein